MLLSPCYASLVGSVVFDSVTPWTVAGQTPLSMGFSRQEYWSGLSCPPPSDLPNPGACVSYVSCIGRWVPYHSRYLGSPENLYRMLIFKVHISRVWYRAAAITGTFPDRSEFTTNPTYIQTFQKIVSVSICFQIFSIFQVSHFILFKMTFNLFNIFKYYSAIKNFPGGQS